MKLVYISLSLFLSLSTASADQLVRRLVVFPVDTSSQDLQAGEKAWWKIREELTQNRRFLMASKDFMKRRDVYQPRRELDAASAILLGKHLDSDTLIVSFINKNYLNMIAYSTQNGSILWKKNLALNFAVTVTDQIEGLASKLTKDFIASIPYQGFQILDPIVGKAVYEEGKKQFAKIEVGTDSTVRKGDALQWIRVTGQPPLFQEGGQVTVLAEGIVEKIENGIVTAEVVRATELQDLKEKTMVRFPTESQRLKENFALQDSPVLPEIVSSQMKPTAQENGDKKSVVFTISSVASMAAMILLAF